MLVQSLSLSQGELKYTLVNRNATDAVRQTLKKRKVQGILFGAGSVTLIITRGVKIHSSQQKCNKCGPLKKKVQGILPSVGSVTVIIAPIL